jgi:hypothetical protein
MKRQSRKWDACTASGDTFNALSGPESVAALASVMTIPSGSVWSGRDCNGTDLLVNIIFAEGNALR